MIKGKNLVLLELTYLITLSVCLIFLIQYKNMQDMIFFKSGCTIWRFSPDSFSVKPIYDNSYNVQIAAGGGYLYVMTVNDSGQRVVYEFSRNGSLLREVSNEITTPVLNEMHFGVFAYREGYLYGILPGEEFGTYELVRVSVKTGKGERLTDSLSIFSVTGAVFSFSGDWVYTVGNHGNGKHYWEPYLILYNLRTGVRQELLFNAIIQKEFNRPFLDGPNLYFPLNEEKSDGGHEYVLYHYFIDEDEVQFKEEIRLYEDVNCDKLVCNGQTGSPIYNIHDGTIIFVREDGYLYERKPSGHISRLWDIRGIDTYFSSVFSFGKTGYLYHTDSMFEKRCLFFRNKEKNVWFEPDLTKKCIKILRKSSGKIFR